MANKLSLASTVVTLAVLSNASPKFFHEADAGDSVAKRNINRGTCSDTDFGRFTSDYTAGIGYANKVLGLIDEDNFYWATFMPKSHWEPEDVDTYKNDYLTPYTSLSTLSDLTVTINCRSSSNTECGKTPINSPPGYQSYAVTDVASNTITLCDPYFDQPPDAENHDDWCNEEGRTLDEFETGAFTILHEFGHLNYKLNPPLQDYGYGSKRCQELAETDEDQAWNNADNWMLTALGAYWEDRCHKEIPISEDSNGGDSPSPQSTSSSTSSTSTATPTSTSTTPPYATGTCHIHVNEYQIGCDPMSSNLRAEITMWDNAGTQIGYTNPNGNASDPANFPGINAGSSLEMTSSLPSVLEVTGEHDNDYIQFTLKSNPQLSWTSHDERNKTNSDLIPYCQTGGWDPKDGSCIAEYPTNAKKQMDCWFQC